MRTASRFWTVVIALCTVGSAQSYYTCVNGPPAPYSRKAVTLDVATQHPVRVTSPDGQKSVQVKTVMDDPKTPDGWRMDLAVKVDGRVFRTHLVGFDGELAWSPDSKAFAVTLTTGGGAIGSRVYAFFVDRDGMKRVDVSEPIEKHFGHPVRCEIDVTPNTGFITWQEDSSTLLVAAEVIPVSFCRCMGTYRVYEMSLPTATIKSTMSQVEAKKKLWPFLGCELRHANDKCVALLERHNRPIQESTAASGNR